jgi:Prp8 binding protein
MPLKRRLEESDDTGETNGEATAAKRMKTAAAAAVSTDIAVTTNNTALMIPPPPPPSEEVSLLPEPCIKCIGHGASITSLDFCSSTNRLCTGSVDKSVLIWNIEDKSVKNTCELSGHKNAILQCCWGFDGDVIYTASADKTVGIWDSYTGKRIRKLTGHVSHVNAVCAGGKHSINNNSNNAILGHQTFLSCGNDNIINVWDLRTYKCVHRLHHSYQLTSLAIGGDRIFSGGIDESIQEWDIRKLETIRKYDSHVDTITGLKISPDNSYLLSNAMDGQVIAWDVNDLTLEKDGVINTPYKTFLGAIPNTQEQTLIRCDWSADGTKVCAGSNDTCSFVWNFDTCDLINRLAGHTGCVNDVIFCGAENILASGGNDGIVILGEL